MLAALDPENRSMARAMHGRKRKRCSLESYPESATVTKLTDLIGRGQMSISAAAELAQSVVQDNDLPDSAVHWMKGFFMFATSFGGTGSHCVPLFD